MVNLNRTKRFHFDLKCTKIARGWGSTTDPAAWGSLQQSQLLDGLGGEEKRREGRGGEVSEWKGGEGENVSPFKKS